MRNVLVTGGCGFIGHHVIYDILKRTDWNIVCLDRLDFSGNQNRLVDILKDFDDETKKRVKVVFHDLRAEINTLVQKEIGYIDTIVHIAAGSHVDRSIENPMEFVLDNVVGTCNILNYGRSIPNLERFIYFSTDEVFGPATSGIQHTEHDRYNSSNPYAATKAGGEELCVSFQNTYGMPIQITHTMNVFGERQHPEKYIPKCINKINNGEVLTIHSDSTKTVAGSRYYIHASDVADAVLFLLNRPYGPAFTGDVTIKCPKFNIVGKHEIDNLTLAKLIAEIQGKELKYEMVDFHSSRPGHDLRYGLSGALMKSLGWEPKIDLWNRIHQVNEWYLNNRKWML